MIKLSKTIFLLFLIIQCEVIQSQVSHEWTSRYGHAGIDGGNAIAIDNLGNVYVTGAEGDPPTMVDLVTIKYSSNGQQQWLARYNGTGNGKDAGIAMKVDNKGNIIVTGQSEGIGSGYDMVTIKYSFSGEQIWVKRYTSSGNSNDFSGSIGIDLSDNIYIAGLSNENYITIKYGSFGNQIWVNSYGTVNNLDIPFAITVDSSGNCYVTGDTAGDSTTLRDIATIKYNALGIMKWVVKYNGPRNENDYGLAIGVDSRGNVYVCGGSQGDLLYDDYVTVKYDSLGIEQWNRRYNGSANFLDQARSLVIDNSDNVYITGYSTHAGTGYDFTTIKYNTNGDQLWIARYNNGLNDMANDMTIDNFGNIYVTGESDGSGTSKDYATVKYDSSGNQLWGVRYDYSGEYPDYPSSVAVDKNGNVFVTGQSDRDMLTIKYSQLTGVSSNFSKIPKEFFLSQNYPNPFNPVTNFGFGISKLGFVSLKVFNVMGEEITPLVNENKSPGIYEVEFDGSPYPSGIYFYRLEIDGNTIDTKRMILLK
jgi:hypothetical protein